VYSTATELSDTAHLRSPVGMVAGLFITQQSSQSCCAIVTPMISMASSLPFALACMGGPDILMVLAAVTVGGSGLLFFSYLPYRAAMNALARGPLLGKPATLFAASLAGGVLWLAATWGCLVMVLSVKAVGFAWLVIVLGVAGCLGWFVLLVAYWSGRHSKKKQAAKTSVPRLQVWMQDLFTALLCYGSGLTILAAAGDFNREHAEDFLPWAVYLLVAGTLGMLVAADVCRRSPTCQRPLPRAVLFVGIFTFFTPTLPVALLAWWRWRRALAKASV